MEPSALRAPIAYSELAMRITDVRTFLVSGGTPERAGWRHWLFVKVHTDAGLYGVGECWGWPPQPDTGRFGGLWQMKKMAAIAEAHQVMVAPHQGSLGPVAEMAAVHLLATLPNYLIHEYLVNDVPQRYEVMTGQPVIEDGHILVPDRPGLGVDLDEEAIERYPPHGNAIPVQEDPDYDYQYVAAHQRRAAWLSQS